MRIEEGGWTSAFPFTSHRWVCCSYELLAFWRTDLRDVLIESHAGAENND